MSRILLIDDDPKIVEDMLSLFGYDVQTATDGFAGIQTLYANRSGFDLVILDVQMPKMDGWAVLKLIRSGSECPNIPIVMLTACSDEKHLVNGLRRGADKYLTKPITPNQLLAEIEAISRRIEWSEQSARNTAEEIDGILHESVKLLTNREKELLKFIVQGYSNSKIGETLVISETTVKNHLAHIFKKLNVSNRTQAAFVAQKLKLC